MALSFAAGSMPGEERTAAARERRGAGDPPAVGNGATDGRDGRTRPADPHVSSLTSAGRSPANRYVSC